MTSSDGMVLMANAAAGELLGYNLADMEHMKLETFLLNADEVLSEAKSRGIAVFTEKTFVKKDGSTIPVSLSATQMSSQSLGLMVIVATDVSERKRSDEALKEYTRKLELYTEELVSADMKMRESEERFRLAFETAPDPIVLVRLKDGRYIDVNTGFVNLTGYERRAVIERGSFDDVSLWFDPLFSLTPNGSPICFRSRNTKNPKSLFPPTPRTSQPVGSRLKYNRNMS